MAMPDSPRALIEETSLSSGLLSRTMRARKLSGLSKRGNATMRLGMIVAAALTLGRWRFRAEG